MDNWQNLLYPLGYLSSLLFGARIVIQWLSSEVKQKSVVPTVFWKLSLGGNLMLMMHSFIQVQFHVFIIQIGNAVISWRNLNLKKPVEDRVQLKKVIYILVAALTFSSLMFFIFNDLSFGWFRIPNFENKSAISPIWHAIGFIGLGLFASRFWIQWIEAEKQKTSNLGPLFWWVSLVGDLLILVYFAKIKDPVNLIGPIFGIIPYVRNLILISKKNKISENKGVLHG